MNVPLTALCDVYNVMVTCVPENELVTGFADQLRETPDGKVLAVRYTVWIPPETVATVLVALPCLTLPDDGLRLRDTVGAYVKVVDVADPADPVKLLYSAAYTV